MSWFRIEYGLSLSPRSWSGVQWIMLYPLALLSEKYSFQPDVGPIHFETRVKTERPSRGRLTYSDLTAEPFAATVPSETMGVLALVLRMGSMLKYPSRPLTREPGVSPSYSTQ